MPLSYLPLPIFKYSSNNITTKKVMNVNFAVYKVGSYHGLYINVIWCLEHLFGFGLKSKSAELFDTMFCNANLV